MPSVRSPRTLHSDPQGAALAPLQTAEAKLMPLVGVIALYIQAYPLLSQRSSIHLHSLHNINIIDCVLSTSHFAIVLNCICE